MGLPNKVEREELAQDISKKILQIRLERKINAGKLIKIIKSHAYYPLNLNFICQVSNGVHTYLPRPPKTGSIIYALENLKKLSILLYSLEIDNDDRLIGRIKEKYPGFEYPPNIE